MYILKKYYKYFSSKSHVLWIALRENSFKNFEGKITNFRESVHLSQEIRQCLNDLTLFFMRVRSRVITFSTRGTNKRGKRALENTETSEGDEEVVETGERGGES